MTGKGWHLVVRRVPLSVLFCGMCSKMACQNAKQSLNKSSILSHLTQLLAFSLALLQRIGSEEVRADSGASHAKSGV